MVALLLPILFCLSELSVAQDESGPGNPQWNVNIVGPTVDPNDVRDLGLRQQNEPACAIRPGDSSCIICAYNDYRTLDVPAVGDAWQGVSMSCDAGATWLSRIAPGSGADLRAAIDAKFAADPRVSAIPGMAILNFIGGFRGEDRGVLAIQHWLESNQEDGDFYEPALDTIIAETGTDGRFIDKPELLAVLDEGSKAGTITLSMVMENSALGTVTRDFPSGTLYLAHAVFTGSQSVKVLVKTSNDWGQTWANKSTKLTESQNLVSGITMTAMGGSVLAVWRQAGDVNDVDAMYYAITTNGGKAWSKPAVLTDICQFDQGSITTATNASLAGKVTFRTNDFPWVANDGQNFYMFYSDRIDRASNPNQVCDSTGISKVYMRHSADGTTWSNSVAIDPGPGSGPGYQFMPAAFGASGKVQVAWYDTRRENIVDLSLNEIADYSPDGLTKVNRKIDVYTARVSVKAGSVVVSPSTRVSQYRSIFFTNDGGPGASPTLYEIDASFGNAVLYGSGRLAFLGDYIAVAGQEFRRNGSGWTSNNSAASSIPELNKADFFVAWADNRDLRGAVTFGAPGVPASQYTPPDNLPPVPASAALSPDNASTGEKPDAIAATKISEPGILKDVAMKRQSAEGIEDTAVDPSGQCMPGQDRTRDANIYGALIRDEKLRMAAPTPSKPLNGIQRAYPVALTNTNETPLGYRLYIATQPGLPATVNRASFRQQPAFAPFPGVPAAADLVEDLTIPANSTFARTVFVSSTNPAATINVNAYDGDCATGADNAGTDFQTNCAVLAAIVLGGTAQAGTLQQPDYESGVCADATSTCFDDVLLAELHNPLLENPLLENPLLENPLLENPLLENPLLENPLLENPLLENPLLENPLLENYGFENPLLENPLLENPLLENPLLENPLLENPLLENPLLENPLLENPLLENPLLENTALSGGITYMDITAAITNDGNVSTAYSADLTVTSSMSNPNVASQLIAWTQYATPASRNCELRAQIDNQVLAAVQNPDAVLSVADINNPFQGEISFIAAPGQTVFVTHRIFGKAAELQAISISGFTTSSQAANCIDSDGTIGADYFCETSLRADNEQILLDAVGPVFSGLSEGDVIPAPPIEADRPGGACVDLVGGGFVSATDESSVSISCSLVSTGEELCTVADPENGLSIPVMTLPDLDPVPVSCTATDEAGNSTTIGLLIAVEDNAAPSITMFPMAPVELTADSVTGTATLDFESLIVAIDVDMVDPDPALSCMADGGQLSGEPLPAGSTTVTCTAMDASGNISMPIDYTVNVNDITHPVVTVTGADPQIIEAGDPYVELGATATDNVGVVGGIVTDASTLDTGVPGDYFVTYTASDGINSTTAIRTVSIVDSVDPEFTSVLADMTEPATSVSGAIVTFATPTVTDNASAAPEVSCTPASGSTFAIGTTTVTCTATDASGNSASASFDVMIEDTIPPDITNLSLDITIEALESGGAMVSYSLPDATDNASATVTIDCQPPSGSVFPVGMTTVTCTATDENDNSAMASFLVTVQDTVGPIVIPIGANPMTLEVGLPYNEPGATASDDVGVIGGISTSGTVNNVIPGSYSITYTAVDAASNMGSATRIVNVVDTTGPALTGIPADFTVEAATAAGNVVTYTSPTATDASDGGATVTCSPSSGSTFPLGLTTVTCTATDGSGNSSQASFVVEVEDSTAPVVTVPLGDVFAQIQSPAGAVVDYSADVSVSDTVDPAPSLDCVPASGSTFAPGDTTVTCTGTDASGNNAVAVFGVSVGYAGGIGITPNKRSSKAGSSNPLTWAWQDEFENNVDSSGDEQLLRIVQCEDGTIILDEAGDPGASGFKTRVDDSWEYNWQSNDEFGNPLDKGTYCASVTSGLTGQMLESPPINLR